MTLLTDFRVLTGRVLAAPLDGTRTVPPLCGVAYDLEAINTITPSPPRIPRRKISFTRPTVVRAAGSRSVNPLPMFFPYRPPAAAALYGMSGCPSSLTRPTAGSLEFLRSEEHTSELQSPYDLVCRLL